ncbi:MAG: pyridoxal phosphate-dependent aminotransferase [Chloroflexi bacterium]|nr:pyridoxal phosphate-dependent aminotransferase [Chloroflexota bacterium]
MTFNFDTEIDRSGTDSVKWGYVFRDGRFTASDQSHAKHGAQRLLPMWVADMDFSAPPAVIAALQARAAHGVFGYTVPGDSYYEAVIEWMAQRYGRPVQRDWFVLTPGVVTALNLLVSTFVQPGEKVLVQRPVYYPFFSAITNHGAEIVSNSLVLENGRYHIDFDDLAAKAADPAVKMAILCSPHNPVGRVWTQEELTRFGDICLANDVLVVSDEIHCDLIHPGSTFTSFAAISEEFNQKSIICTAPSKTFNLAGLKTSNILIPDKAMRLAFHKTLDHNGLMGGSVFGLTATEAAYRHGTAWLEEALVYIHDNYRFMADYIAQHLPQLHVIEPQGTYLAWVDFRALGLDPARRKQLLMDEARVFLDDGEMFGPEGGGFERFNLACPRSILVEALERIHTAVSRLP